MLLLAILPIPTKIAKKTEVRVALANGRPVPGIKVWQDWECFGLIGKGLAETVTDSAGLARFPARYGFGSVLSRLFFRLLPLIAVHASYGSNLNIEIDVPNPMRAVFRSPSFRPLEPFAQSGSYLDSVGRNYFPQEDKSGQRVTVSWQAVDKAGRVQLTI
jgi:hypothetical protein